jgi:hypothetical protein
MAMPTGAIMTANVNKWDNNDTRKLCRLSNLLWGPVS